MRFLIYGAGVIGSIFAGRLISGGHDVTLLARSKRLDILRADGLLMKDIFKKQLQSYTVNTISELLPEDVYDYIFVCVQYVQIDDILPKLRMNKSENIVLVVNNPNGYDAWSEYLGSKLMLGFPAFGGVINSSTTEYYISIGFSRIFQTTTFGEPDGSITTRLTKLIGIFKRCGIPSVVSRCMDNWQKCHLAVVLPIAGAILKNSGSVKLLARNNSDIKQMICATRQGFNALKEIGIKVHPKKLNFYYMPAALLCFIFSVVFRTRIAEFSMEKHTNNAKPEMRALAKAFEELIKETQIDKCYILTLSWYLLAE